MCGRYTLAKIEDLQARFEAQNALPDLRPNFNSAPGQLMPVVTRNSPNKLELMRWGLVPFWAKDINIGFKMINARAETVHEKPAFRSSLKSRRCMVPVTGYYEWKKEGKLKQPYYYQLPEQPIFAFAGLTADWHDDHGNELQTYTIITTAANALAASVHERMPVILAPDDEDVWLDPLTPLGHVIALLKPYDAQAMTVHPVSTAVNQPGANHAGLLVPLAQEAPGGATNLNSL